MDSRKKSLLLKRKTNWIFSDPTKLITNIRRYLFLVDLLVLCLSLTGLGLTVIANNHNYERNFYTKEFFVKDENRIVYKIFLHDSKENSSTLSLKFFSTLFSCLSGFFIYVRYQLYLNLLILYHEESLTATIKSAKLKTRMLLEIFVLFFHAPPYFNYIIEIYQFDVFYASYTTEAIITILMNARFYLVFRFFFLHHKFNDQRVATICNNSGCQANISFLTKTLIHDKKSVFMSMSIVCYMLIFGMSMRIAERPYMYVSKLDWDYVWNGMWCVIILGVTVGYGDFYPRTHIGRILGFSAFLFGNFLKSLAEVFLHSTVHFSPSQEKAYQKLKLSQKYQIMRKKAAHVIKHLLIYNLHQKRYKYPAALVMQDKINVNMFAIMKNLVDFRNQRLEYLYIKRQPTMMNLYTQLQRNVVGHVKDLSEAIDCLHSVMRLTERLEVKSNLIFERAAFVQERQRLQLNRIRELFIKLGGKNARLEREYKEITNQHVKSMKHYSVSNNQRNTAKFLEVSPDLNENEASYETRARSRTQQQKVFPAKKRVTIAEENIFGPSNFFNMFGSYRPVSRQIIEIEKSPNPSKASSILRERRMSREAPLYARVYEEDSLNLKKKERTGNSKRESTTSTAVGSNQEVDKTLGSIRDFERKNVNKDEGSYLIFSSKRLLENTKESAKIKDVPENVNASMESIEGKLKKSGTLLESTYDNDSSQTDLNSILQEKYKPKVALNHFDCHKSIPNLRKLQERDEGGFLMMESIDFEKECLLLSSKEIDCKQKPKLLSQEPSYGFEFQSFLLLDKSKSQPDSEKEKTS